MAERSPQITFFALTAFVLLISLGAAGDAASDERDVFFSEQFDGLSAWEPFYFPKVKRHSEYRAVAEGGNGILVMVSNSSASALVYKREFDVYKYPRARWRWKVGGVYKKGDVTRKSGDDYPARVYVMFKYDPAAAPLGKRIKYGLAKALYGQYPPHSSLNYIWANRAEEKGAAPSPYAAESMMVILRSGPAQAGQWVEEEVDVLEGYRRAFGEDPPREARIAVMDDSDDTGESSVSYIDYIEVFR